MHERFKEGGPLAASVGDLADLYAEVRTLRLEMQKATDAVKARETEIWKAIMATLQESPDTGASGQTYRVQLVEKTVYPVKNWDAFWPWVAEHKQYQLMQKRANDAALRELFEAYNQLPPGVEESKFDSLSFSKI